MTIFNFAESLAKSKQFESWAGWTHIYETLFPKHLSFQRIEDISVQLQGADVALFDVNGDQQLIEEKIVFGTQPDGSPWNNFMLEYAVGDKPGWINKPQLAQHLLYVNVPLGTANLFDMKDLQFAFSNSLWNDKSLRSFAIQSSNNDSRYETRCLQVSAGRLFQSVEPVGIVTFEPVQSDDKKTVFKVSNEMIKHWKAML